MTGERTKNARGDGDQLRMDLVAAATELLVVRQPVAVPSLRAIARAAGVTPAAVYLHFESVGALVLAVLEEQFANLRETLELAHGRGSDPHRRLSSVARAYVGWGLEHPGTYQLLFESADGLPTDVGQAESGGDLLSFWVECVRDCGVDRRVAQAVAMRTWASVHGLVSLRIHKSGAPWVSSPDVDAGSITLSLMRGQQS